MVEIKQANDFIYFTINKLADLLGDMMVVCTLYLVLALLPSLKFMEQA